MIKNNYIKLIAFLTFGFLFIVTTNCKKNDENLKIKDIDGNIYNTITIGMQIWMKENLKTTHYNDGTSTPLVTDFSTWSNLTTPGYCWYNNDSLTYKNEYGAMYNWYTVNTGKLCPIGWHVPLDTEWTSLTDYLGGLSIASGKLKEADTIHWNSPNTGATNESKFTALPGGYRSFKDGAFFSIRNNGTWWTSSSNTSFSSWSRAMTNYNTFDVQIISNDDRYGISVRCIKDFKSTKR